MTSLFLKLFVKNYNDTENPAVREKYGTLAGIFGIICNLFLCTFKISVGIIVNSISITADGFNNLSDMGSSVITMISFKMANKPADKEHPFGHGRIEYISAFIVALLILLVGFELFKDSVSAVLEPSTPKYSIFAIAVLIVSALIKIGMFCFNKALSKRIDSDTLSATAQDCINDAIATAAILISVIISKIFTLKFNLDAIMGIAVSVFIFYSGIMAAKETVSKILGQPPTKADIQNLKQLILSYSDFLDIHDLIIHNYGPGRTFGSVHVEVPQNIDIVHCHEQVDTCEKQVYEELGIMLTIHMDPVDNNNETVIFTKESIQSALKVIDERITIHDFRMTPKGENRTNLIFDAVLPSDLKLSQSEFKAKAQTLASLIDSTFVCVITVDSDFIGN